MALSITVNGGGTFTASMEEGPVSFSASLGAIGPAGPGVAAGGTTGQILVKTTNADYATGWIDNAARSVFITGRNNTGSTIAKGAVVYLSGATGNKATIALALANSESTSARTIGITKAEIANNADGDVVISGAIENIDTSAFSAGQVVYLSATTAGGLQTTLPTQPNHGVVIGIVTRQNANNGSIEVTVQNYQELVELSDVLISNPLNGQVLTYESASGLWKNLAIPAPDLSAYLTSATAAATYQTIAGMSDYLSKAGNLSGLADAATARTNLGLGSSDTVSFAEVRLPSPDNHAKLTHEFWRPFSAAHGDLGIEYRGDKIKFQDATEQATKGLLPANNLSDLASAATARTNLDVYSKSESDALVPAASTTTAGKVELATDAEAVAGTSATLVAPLATSRLICIDPNINFVGGINTAASTSGTGASTGADLLSFRVTGPNASTAGFATRGANHRFPSSSVSAGYNFGTRSGFSSRCYSASWGSTITDVVFRMIFGRMGGSIPAAATLAARGYGIEWNFSTRTLNILAHDGTTLTTTAATWNPVSFRDYDIRVLSDGSGTISCYIDGALVGTSTGGPTTTSTTSQVWWQAEIQNTSASAGGNIEIRLIGSKTLLAIG